MNLLEGWKRDWAITHQWEERHCCDVGVLWLVVDRDYSNHEVFTARVCARYGRTLRRTFATADEAKLAAQKLALKIGNEILTALRDKLPSSPREE